MKLENKNIAIFLANFYEELEYWYPYYRMKEEGANVTSVAAKVDTYKGKNGLPANADVSISDVSSDQFDALIVPGGYAPDHMRRAPKMISFLKEMYDSGKVVAAICHAGWALASAGILEGKKVTSFFSIKDDIVNAGADWVDQEVVVDGKLITSRKPGDLPAFCQAIIKSLS